MLDSAGVLQTDETNIKEAALYAYKHGLRNIYIKLKLEGLQDLKEALCEQRLKESKQIKIPDWTEEELDIALNHLKKDA